MAFDNQLTYDFVILSNPQKIISTHDTRGWKHIVDLCVYGDPFTTLTPIHKTCSVFGSDFYIEK